MNDWNQAYRLAAFEIKASLRNLMLILAFYVAMSLIFMMSFDVYLEGDFKGFDIMFLLVFFMFPAWMKGKEFQMQKMDGNLWSSPPIIMLQQLPISKNTIVKSRFIIHAFCSFPFQLILLIAMPLMSDNFREGMTPVAYPVFVLLWIAISIAVGFMMAASEAGGNFRMKEIVLSFIYILIAAAAIYLLFPMLSGSGFIEWTMAIAVEWSLLTGITAVALMIAGWKYWQADMKKTIKKTDYL